jgi:hypothetical protein
MPGRQCEESAGEAFYVVEQFGAVDGLSFGQRHQLVERLAGGDVIGSILPSGGLDDPYGSRLPVEQFGYLGGVLATRSVFVRDD